MLHQALCLLAPVVQCVIAMHLCAARMLPLSSLAECRYNLDSQLAAPEPLRDDGCVVQHVQSAATQLHGEDSTGGRVGTETCAAGDEQLQRTQPPAVETTDDCHATASQQSTAALLQFLRRAVNQTDALLFEIRDIHA